MAKVTFTVLLTLFILWTAGVVESSFGGQEFLKVPPSQFLHSLKLVNQTLKDVSSSLLQLQRNYVQDTENLHLPSAISTCVELMSLSAEELRLCVSAVKTPQGQYEGTGNLIADLRTWLGGILVNADTCMDGFEGSTNIKDHLSVGIEKVNIMVSDVLNQVVPNTISDHFTTPGSFPSWLKQSDKKLLRSRAQAQIDVVVAADGTGNFTKVMDAVRAAPIFSPKRFILHIKRGVYTENVIIDDNKQNLMVIGDGKDVTIITGDLRHSKNLTTYKTATFCVKGNGFIAQKISFRNTAGPKGNQAVALLSSSDLSVFYQCGFFGYQDTLYAHAGRQFYKECLITGTIDFIFGYGTVVFQNCDILVRKGLLPHQNQNTITANGGKKDRSVYGFSFQFCKISAAPDLLPFVRSVQTFLGRPWKEYATTIFMESYISNVVSPRGWLEWQGSLYLDTLYFAEYKNYGAGAKVQNRVNWTNYHVLNNSSQATKFSVAEFISGEQWLPSTGVPFIPGLGDKNFSGGRQ